MNNKNIIKCEKNNEKGITLVALVVTIVVMLILAGITVNMTIGDNGLLTTAQRIQENMEKAQSEAQDKINSMQSNEYLEDGTKTGDDTTAPKINSIDVTKLSDTSIKVSVNVTETGSGIAKIEYSIDGGQNFIIPNYNKDTSYVFKNLNLETTQYNLVVRVTDISGNSSTANKVIEKNT